MARLRPARSVEGNFRRIYPRLLRRYFRRGRRLADAGVVRSADAGAINEELHRFRIRTKRMRYITELYEELFPDELRGALKAFRAIQQVLGDLQDQCMLQVIFERRLPRVRAARRKACYRRVVRRALARQNVSRRTFFERWDMLSRSGLEHRLLSRIGQKR